MGRGKRVEDQKSLMRSEATDLRNGRDPAVDSGERNTLKENWRPLFGGSARHSPEGLKVNQPRGDREVSRS